MSYKTTIKNFVKSKKESFVNPLTLPPYYGKNVLPIALDDKKDEQTYKEPQQSKYVYDVSIEVKDLPENKKENEFADLLTDNGWIASVFDIDGVTDDFLTGYYIGHQYLNKTSGKHNVFFAGCGRPGFIQGLAFRMKAQKLHWYGADKAGQPDDAKISGVVQQGDLTKLNFIRSLGNQLDELVPNGLSLFVSDINYDNVHSLLKIITIGLNNVRDDGLSVLRIPDPHAWGKIGFASILNLIFFILNTYNHVRVFKTPWGTKTRYYLLYSEFRKVPDKNGKAVPFFDTKKYSDFLGYLESIESMGNEDAVHYYSRESLLSHEDFIPHILDLQKTLVTNEVYDDIAFKWISEVMGYKAE